MPVRGLGSFFETGPVGAGVDDGGVSSNDIRGLSAMMADNNADGFVTAVDRISRSAIKTKIELLQMLDHREFSAMHEAAKVGAWAIAEVLSRWGSELSHMDNRGMTPLGYAAEAGHSKTCEKLIALGAKASGTQNADRRGYLPLHLAAENGQAGAIQALVDSGCDVNPRNPAGRTPLHLAAWSGHLEAVLRLVKCGAGIDAKCKSQYTALHYAIKGTHLAVFDALIENGCKVRTSAAKHNIVALASAEYNEVPHGIVRTAQKNLAEATRPVTGVLAADQVVVAELGELGSREADSREIAGSQAAIIGEVLEGCA